MLHPRGKRRDNKKEDVACNPRSPNASPKSDKKQKKKKDTKMPYGVIGELIVKMSDNFSQYDYSVLCRHCGVENPDGIACSLTGSIPDWLRGQLIYNGPGLTKFGQNEYRHAFDASAILQKFNIEKDKVTYSSRFVRSKTYEQNMAAGSITRAEFGTPAPASKGMFSRFLDAMDPEKMFSDNALVSVCEVGDSYYAMCETPFMVQINPNTLETEDRININKRHGLMTQSPHPVVASDGVYTVGQSVGVTGPKYSILKYPLDGNLKQGKIMTSLPARWRLSPAYMHSMAMTENYAILIEQPLAVSLSELLSDIVNNAPFIDGLKWHNEPVLIHVVDRKTWKPLKTRYVADPFFFMHVANAYEDGEHIIMDIPTYKDASILHNMFITTLREQKGKYTKEFVSAFRSEMYRFVIPLNVKGKEKLVTLPGTTCSASWSGQEILLQSERVTSIPLENPCINPKKKAEKHQFIWAMAPDGEGGDFGHVMKLDVSSRETLLFREDHIYSAAPEFVARPGSNAKDDGVILVQGLNSLDEKEGYLLVLDASTMSELARATFRTPSAVTMPLHALFIPAAR
ncbi:carotenoid isomerooxygenase-like isoform X1 [Macrobrachium nipponense]|uniref:carotenoid isomerooxygenase-like isoform X1 n=2 Tax=Macrobrachium nipponense TaxID=159736 RepID=UPI0030C85AE0